MNPPFDYDRLASGEFGGTIPTATDFEQARVVILPVPLDRTTSRTSRARETALARSSVSSSHMGTVGRGNRDQCLRHQNFHAAGNGIPVCHDGRDDRLRFTA